MTAIAEAELRARHTTTVDLATELTEATDEKKVARTIARYGRVDLLRLGEFAPGMDKTGAIQTGTPGQACPVGADHEAAGLLGVHLPGPGAAQPFAPSRPARRTVSEPRNRWISDHRAEAR
ncbi:MULTISPECIES: hypothetical protein [unclassified Streptomyces]|uniref:hypothetical protein n=1 Tax=Streptomyces TaxID=1883 RepID=UPI001EEFB896|nr:MULTISPECIES: hypothetical protein [unclassified Streptomyces]